MPAVVSAVGAISKGETGKVMLIDDSSRPIGKDLNDSVTPSKFSFNSLEGVIKTMKKMAMSGWQN